MCVTVTLPCTDENIGYVSVQDAVPYSGTRSRPGSNVYKKWPSVSSFTSFSTGKCHVNKNNLCETRCNLKLLYSTVILWTSCHRYSIFGASYSRYSVMP